MRGARALLPEVKSDRAPPGCRRKSFGQNEGGVPELQEPESEGLADQGEAAITFGLPPSGQPCTILGIRSLSGQIPGLPGFRG